MVEKTRVRVAGLRRTLLSAVTVVTASLMALAWASPALAVEHHPKGDFAPFADCPLSNPATNLCLLAKTESGEVKIGKKTVPITKTITLQGGAHEAAIEHLEFIGAEDGNTLSKTPQTVPGGLAGLINCNEISEPVARLTCELVFQNGLTGVTATTELAAPASAIGISVQNLIEAEGTALSLPVKVKLDNPLLGGSCYIGSNASPIVLNLTTGTTSPPPPNKPIKGKVGEISFQDEFAISTIVNNTLVDNMFAAPTASGCGGLLAPVIDPLVNLQLGLPAAAGTNTAIQNNTVKDANAESVKASE
jgi:hypothetical protein